MTRISYMDLEPESSLTGLSAVSGDELVGVGAGGLLLEGKTIGASAGVAELEGTLADVSGVAAVAGPSGIGGLASGAEVGAATGVEAGEETDGGGLVGDKTGADPLGEGVAAVGGGIDGVITGDEAGATEGEMSGDFEGDVSGDFEGDMSGDFEGEEDGDVSGEAVGDLAGAVVGEEKEGRIDLAGEGEGALSASTMKDDIEMLKARKTSRRSRCNIFGVVLL